MSLQDVVSHFRKRDLSGLEIQNLIHKAPILYSDLERYTSLKQLLGKEKYAIVLYQTSSKTTGHFVAITLSDVTGKVRYCDSYGIPNPDREIQYTPYDEKLPPYLTQLLAPYDYESNTVDYQAKNPVVSTCGRWSSVFCKWRNLSLAQIKEIFSTNSDPYMRDPDNAVCLLTMLSLHDIREYEGDVHRPRPPGQ